MNMQKLAMPALAALALAACAPTPGQPESTPRPTSQQPSVSASPTATATVTPTVDPTALKPGTNHSYAAAKYAYPAKDVHDWLVNGTQAKNPPNKKIAFLTFDDGPNDRITPKVLAALKRAKVPATFFYVTNSTGLGSADPKIVKQTIAAGHSIDVHSHTHKYSLLYPGRQCNAKNVIADRATAIQAIHKVLGKTYQVSGYRYPGGHMSWQSLGACDAALAQAGAYWIDWNTMNGDAEANAPTSVDGMLQLVRSGLAESGNPDVAVVLMHDHRYADLTVAAVPEIVSYLKSEGYEFGVIN